MEVSIKNFSDQVFFPGNTNPANFAVTVSYIIGGSEVIGVNAFQTLAGCTYAALADGLTTSFLGQNPSDMQALTKWTKVRLYGLGGPPSGIVNHDMDCDSISFQFDGVSNLVYQNRSAGDDTGLSSTDVAQMPLFEVQCTGPGSGPQMASRILTQFDVNPLTGVYSIDNNIDSFLIAEPSRATFTNVKKVVDVIAPPGVMKQSKLKNRLKIKFNDLIQKIRIFAYPAVANHTKFLGSFKYIWFRKMIDLSGSANYQVVFQQHYAAGCTCYYKRAQKTAAYVLNIQ